MRCHICGEEKPDSEFYPKRTDCKTCHKKVALTRYYQTKHQKTEKRKEYEKNYQKNIRKKPDHLKYMRDYMHNLRENPSELLKLKARAIAKKYP